MSYKLESHKLEIEKFYVYIYLTNISIINAEHETCSSWEICITSKYLPRYNVTKFYIENFLNSENDFFFKHFFIAYSYGQHKNEVSRLWIFPRASCCRELRGIQKIFTNWDCEFSFSFLFSSTFSFPDINKGKVFLALLLFWKIFQLYCYYYFLLVSFFFIECFFLIWYTPNSVSQTILCDTIVYIMNDLLMIGRVKSDINKESFKTWS